MSASTTATSASLVRGLGLVAASAILIGDTIGTGVFLKARVMTCNVETPLMVVAVWIAGGLLSLAGALTYAELAAMMPRAGGEYVFIRSAYGPLAGFLYGWTRVFVASTGGAAALAAGLAIFANVLTNGALGTSGVSTIAIAAIVIATALNCAAVSVSGRLATAFAALKVALVLLVGVGAMLLAHGSWTHFALSGARAACDGVPAATRGGIAGFGAAMVSAMWAYNGWNEMTYVAEEVRSPSRNLPLAIIGGITAIALLYVSANAAYFYVLAPAEIAGIPASGSVATAVVTRAFGAAPSTALAGVLAMSIFGSLLVSTLVSARIPYAMARDGLFFAPLAAVSPRTHVPVRALVAQAAWVIVLVLSGSYDTLTDYAVFCILIFVSLATASVYVFRRSLPDEERAYRTWGYPITPALFLLAAGFLIVNTLLATPVRALAGLGLMAAGLPFYRYWSARERRAAIQATRE